MVDLHRGLDRGYTRIRELFQNKALAFEEVDGNPSVQFKGSCLISWTNSKTSETAHFRLLFARLRVFDLLVARHVPHIRIFSSTSCI